MDYRVYLKVKLKSLAEEAKIIRHEEKKGGDHREGLHRHRVDDVRSEARHTVLAYNFIRGRSYKQTEPFTTSPPNRSRVLKMVKKYGEPGVENREELLDAWFEAE